MSSVSMPARPSAKRSRTNLKALVAAIALASTGAQAEVVSGRVSDATTGRSIGAAIVTISELGLTATTESDGSYRFRDVDPGTYTVRVRYYGLEGVEQTIRVVDGKNLELPLALNDLGGTIEEVTVYGQLIETGQARAINDQRTARSVKTVISRELFGQVNDGNIATAMQRMPGLSADSNGGDEIPRYINIRGVSTAYNSVQVDSVRMPASGTGRGSAYGNTGRGFALDDIPSDAIEKIEIIKAPTPDMDGDGLGGSVNLVTKSALDYDGRRFEYRLGGNYTALRDDTFGNGTGTYMDQFEFGDGRELGVSVTASYYETNEGFDNRDLDYAPLVPDAPVNSGLGLEQIVADAPEFNTALGYTESPMSAVFYNEDTEFNTNVIDRERLGFAANFDVKWSDRTSFYAKTFYNTEDRFVDDYRYHKIMDNDHNDNCRETFDPANPQSCFLSRILVDGPAPSDPVRLGSDPTRRSTIDFVDLNSGRATLDADGNPRGEVRYDGQTNDTELNVWSFTLGGEHLFDRATLTARMNISRATQDDFELDGDLRREGFAFEYAAPDGFFRAEEEDYRVVNGDFSYLPDVDPFSLVVDETRADTIQPSFFQSEARDSEEDRMSFKIDYERELPEMDFVTGNWKVGAKYARMDREFDYTEVQYEFAEPGDAGYLNVPWANLIKDNPYEQVDGQRMPFTMDTQAAYAFVNGAPTGTDAFEIDVDGGQEDSTEQDYSYEEDILAGYAMATFQAGPLELIAGGRLEYTDTAVDRNVINDVADDGFDLSDVSVVSDDRDYFNFLPSMLLKWEVRDNLLLRLALTETFARPQVVDLVNVRVVDEQDDPVEIEEGNFSLPALESENFDLILEYYTAEGLWSVGLFRKDMTGYSFPAQQIIENSPEFGGRQVAITTPQATGEARNEGIELSVFQRLGFLPAPFDGLYVNANYTFTESDATYPNRETDNLPTRGASRHLAFASLGYEWRGLSAEMQYRYRSPYIEGLAFVDAQGANNFTEDDIFGETEIWNANVSYQVRDQVTVFLNGTNLFNEQNASRQGYANYPEDVYFNERRIAFGIKGTF